MQMCVIKQGVCRHLADAAYIGLYFNKHNAQQIDLTFDDESFECYILSMSFNTSAGYL